MFKCAHTCMYMKPAQPARLYWTTVEICTTAAVHVHTCSTCTHGCCKLIRLPSEVMLHATSGQTEERRRNSARECTILVTL